jgi:hypothetical protein
MISKWFVAVGSERSRTGDPFRCRANNQQEEIMMPNPCSRCFEESRSTLDILKILNRKWSACKSCAHQSVMRTLIEQFQKRRPLWWVVDGASVVPPRIVDYFRRHPPVCR